MIWRTGPSIVEYDVDGANWKELDGFVIALADKSHARVAAFVIAGP